MSLETSGCFCEMKRNVSISFCCKMGKSVYNKNICNTIVSCQTFTPQENDKIDMN